MQMTRKMKINEAKKYVAEKLEIDVSDLINEEVMRELREKHDIGTIISITGSAKGILAKCNIAKLLDININSVDLFKKKLARHM